MNEFFSKVENFDAILSENISSLSFILQLIEDELPPDDDSLRQLCFCRRMSFFLSVLNSLLRDLTSSESSLYADISEFMKKRL